jgi:ankyrin repeat protein
MEPLMRVRQSSLLSIAGIAAFAAGLSAFYAISNLKQAIARTSGDSSTAQGHPSVRSSDKAGESTSAEIVEAALRVGDMERIVRELDNLRSPNKRLDERGTTALQLAAATNNAEAIRLLIRSGADANLPDDQKRTPLMFAAERADTGIVLALLDAGASPTAKDRDARTAGDRVAKRTDPEGQQIAAILSQAAR